jgi:hypothetical protein
MGGNLIIHILAVKRQFAKGRRERQSLKGTNPFLTRRARLLS